MPTCPKCGHQGASDEQCEKCGVIYDRMHTIVELRPLGALGEALAARKARAALPVAPEPLDPPAVPPRAPGQPPPAGDAVKPEPRPATKAAAAVPLVHLVPREKPPVVRGWVVALAAVFVAVAAGSEYLDWRARHHVAAAEETTYDAPYFELAIETVLGESRRELRHVEDPARAQETRLRLVAEVARLKALLPGAGLEPAVTEADGAALDALAGFLANDVPPAIENAKKLGPRAEPTPSAALDQARAALSRAHPTVGR